MKLFKLICLVCVTLLLPVFSVADSMELFCKLNGITCQTKPDGLYHVIYKCQGVSEATNLWLWTNLYTTISELTFKDCKTLKLSFDPRNYATVNSNILKRVEVSNIERLEIIESQFYIVPEVLVLKNISFLERIPPNLLSNQYKGEIMDFRDLTLSNITIGVIESNAINLKNFTTFIISNVSINAVEPQGIRANLTSTKGFIFEKSHISLFKHIGLNITSPKVIINNNEILDLLANGISIQTDRFIFSNNRIENLHSAGLSVKSKDALLFQNRFVQLHSESLSYIEPLQTVNNKNDKFIYNFSSNEVTFMDAGSLNPNIAKYDTVSADIIFSDNILYCACENIGWIFSDVGHGYSSAPLEDFYALVLDEKSNNKCHYTSCQLSVGLSKNLIKNGKCIVNSTPEDVCGLLKRNKSASASEKPATEILDIKKILASSFASRADFCYFILLMSVLFIILPGL